ncbi:hypothetical protein [Tunturiibacter lichenicola]|uniref:hypothetical protein n=1 Tax=Tunturiibacter lichenicola TaxID=2051959 RepID=UPI0021B16421|nr:hypothetical protein [Edaphobacter lichenicola]
MTDKLKFFDLPDFKKTAAITTALASRPEIQAQVSQECIANLERKSASEERVPQIGFSGVCRQTVRRCIYFGLAVLSVVILCVIIAMRPKNAPSPVRSHFHLW